MRFGYTDAEGRHSYRTIRPLGMIFFGQVWLLLAWCELREDFRVFRPDRIRSPEVLDVFEEEPGRTLADFEAKAKREREECDEEPSGD